MKTLSLLSGAALIAAATAGIAIAQGPGPERRGTEGDITRQQVIAHVDEMFARLDADHDGRVTPEEMRAAGAHRRDEMRQHMFDRLDANHDGMISREEFDRAHAMAGGPGGPMPMDHMGPPPMGPGGPGGPGMGGMGRMGGMRGMGGMREMLAANGRVTLEQMRARALEHFDRADTNHDGTLTADERRAAHARMREGPEQPRPN